MYRAQHFQLPNNEIEVAGHEWSHLNGSRCVLGVTSSLSMAPQLFLSQSKVRRRDDVGIVMSKSEDLEGVMRQTGTERLTNAAPDLSSNAMRT